jgi:hypothetical protein
LLPSTAGPPALAGSSPYLSWVMVDYAGAASVGVGVGGYIGQHTYLPRHQPRCVPVDGDYGPVTIRGDFFYHEDNTGNVSECTTIAAA